MTTPACDDSSPAIHRVDRVALGGCQSRLGMHRAVVPGGIASLAISRAISSSF